jgi:tetratricopeptide (TPR) repeat protein
MVPRGGAAGLMRSALIPALAATLLLAACRDNEPAIARGDRMWADSAYPAALDEYRLALAQRDDDQARVRLAHAYARAGRLPETANLYRELLPSHPELAGQAVYDLLLVADRAHRRGDVFTAAGALDAALNLRPEIRIPAYALSVARFHRQRGDPERAADFYVRALTHLPQDSTPRVYYELGLLHEETARCVEAIDYFEAARVHGQRDERRWRTLIAESRWHVGYCAFRLAQEARDRGDVLVALDQLGTMLRLGQPEHLLDQAWLDQGDLLFGIGRFDEALEAYRQVVERSATRTGPLVERAQRRIDEIRFGQPVPDFPF